VSEIEPTSHPEPALRLTITPEPTEEEAAAIAAALSIVSLASQEPTEPESGQRLTPWVVTGRLAAHHAAPRARQRRWSRTLAWLDRNV
jgi:hypothetical protein